MKRWPGVLSVILRRSCYSFLEWNPGAFRPPETYYTHQQWSRCLLPVKRNRRGEAYSHAAARYCVLWAFKRPGKLHQNSIFAAVNLLQVLVSFALRPIDTPRAFHGYALAFLVFHLHLRISLALFERAVERRHVSLLKIVWRCLEPARPGTSFRYGPRQPPGFMGGRGGISTRVVIAVDINPFIPAYLSHSITRPMYV